MLVCSVIIRHSGCKVWVKAIGFRHGFEKSASGAGLSNANVPVCHCQRHGRLGAFPRQLAGVLSLNQDLKSHYLVVVARP